MPDTYTQTERPLRVTTGAGPDALLITGFRGREGLSQLYECQLDLIAPEPVEFADVLGQPAVVELELPEGAGTRYFHGVINRFSQGSRDDTFIIYHAHLVPVAWFLTRRTRSRTFQHLTVPEILKKVLDGLDVDFKIKGKFEPRDYCVQYREPDWNFASRLMEEEGIYYFFAHTEDGAKLVLANTPEGHPDVPDKVELIYEELQGGNRPEGRVWSWDKEQEVVSGKVTLWDHCFELPGKKLDAEATIPATLTVGQVDHDLTAGGADELEVYDYPGAYAQRFDGVDRGGAPRPAEVQKIFDDAKRTVGIRLQESAANAVRVRGTSSCGHLTGGHKFTLTGHFDADGDYYVLTDVHHAARMSDYRSAGSPMVYENNFYCIPANLPFRPRRVTPRPTVLGSQTATVVGPPGEEIFTDKYSRIKVQFHWDREGQNDADSSCWVRVGSPWAGSGWGAIHIPRVGQEVIVDFLEGDPDRPIVVGSVYNADQMPPWGLPANRTQSGVLSRSSPGGAANANAIRFEDKAGSEQIWIHAEKNQDIEVENDETHSVGHDRTKTVGHDETTHVKHDRTETVDNNETITVHGARTETVDKDETITVHGNRTEAVDLNETLTVSGHQSETVTMTQTTMIGLAHTVTVGAAQALTVGGAQTISVGALQAVTVLGAQTISVGRGASETIGGGWSQKVAKDHDTKVGGNRAADVAGNESVKSGKSLGLEAADEIKLICGDASFALKKDGTILLKGKDITIEGSGKITVKADGNMTLKGSKIAAN